MKSQTVEPTLLRAAVVMVQALEAALVDALHDQGFPKITVAHLDVFRHLGEGEGMRVKQLAGLLGISPQSTGEMLRVLASRGWVEITTDPGDQRARNVKTTDQAIRAVEAAGQILLELEAQVCAHLSDRERHAAKEWMLTAPSSLALRTPSVTSGTR